MAKPSRRPLSNALLLAALALGAGSAALGPTPAYADGSAAPTGDKPAAEPEEKAEPCQTKKFHYPKVEKACKEGGRKAAKKIMQGAVKKAKDAGNKDFKCTACHEDLKSYELKKNAVDDLKKWL